MQWKIPKNTDKYYWTQHVTEKMRYYGLSEQKVLGVIRNPKRIETGIAQDTLAVMMPVGSVKKGKVKPKWGKPTIGNFQKEQENYEKKNEEESWNQEIWVMYQIKCKSQKSKIKIEIQNKKLEKLQKQINSNKQLVIISAWRYPGVSPKSNPIPEEILRELEEIA